MANLFLCGFDGCPTAVTGVVSLFDFTQFLGTTGVTATNANISGRCFNFDNPTGNTTVLGRNVPNGVEFTVGFAVRFNTLPGAGQDILTFYDATNGSAQNTLRIVSGNLFQFTRAGTNLGSASTNNISTWAGVYHYIEVRMVLSDTVGLMELYVDGVLWLTTSGVDNKNTVNLFVNQIRFTCNTTGKIDDIYINDASGSVNNGYMGAVKVGVLFPNSDDTAVWARTGGSGTNASAVNENPWDDDTSYLSSSTPNDKDIHNLDDSPGTVQTVYAVQMMARARKDDAGTRTLQIGVKSSATESLSANQGLITTYANYYKNFDVDPNGSVGWTKSAVDALKAVIKEIA